MDAIIGNDFSEFLTRVGIEVADPSLGIGNQLTFRTGPARTIVVPTSWRATGQNTFST